MQIEMPTADNPVTLVQGDCLDVLRALPDGCVDAVITDPPYGIDLENHGNFSRDWTIAGDANLQAAVEVADWADVRRMCLCMFGSAYRPLPGKWRNVLVWDKGPAVGAGGDPEKCWKRTFDLIYVRNNGSLRCGRDSAVLPFWQSPNFRKDHRHHPAAKPVDLMRYLIRQLTPPGGLVLDPFAGSGSTLVAAMMEGRRAVGCEIDAAYCDIIRRRLDHASGTGKGSLFAGVAP